MLSFRNVIRRRREAQIRGNAARADARTVGSMPTRKRRLDRRNLLPRDYLADPFIFGHRLGVTTVLPPGGDPVSQAVALVQHHVAVLVRQEQQLERFTARRTTARFGFSKQYWSLCLLGYEWMGETVLAAAVSVALHTQ
ncbi:hypothetical protein FB474_2379 [Oryzihumus leptocrescens]|uniref:Uncharacterized protein n=2 Tax=Oryzihumus leptocrescens TaxID=297536 RepID=A0A542ZKW1_9MICO|nr:hypothetical protein FB474_2379 [Oryzihumus leptocrescens]